MVKCGDCWWNIGAEYPDGSLFVWCSCGSTLEERKTIMRDYEPISASEDRECPDFVQIPRRKIWQEDIVPIPVYDLSYMVTSTAARFFLTAMTTPDELL